MMDARSRKAKNSVTKTRPKTAKTRAECLRDVKMANHILSLDPDVDPPSPRSARAHVKPQTNPVTLRRVSSPSIGKVEEFDVERRIPSPPQSARQFHPKIKSSKQQTLITRSEIENLRKIVNSNRPKTIMWGDSAPMMNDRIKGDITSTPRNEEKRRTIIIDNDPIDINSPVPAARLISTTAFIQDYIGVPNSLSFIR